MARRASAGFTASLITALDEAKILGVRAGRRSDHRFTGVWPVVVNRRLFARSWTVKPDGWYSNFRKEREGSLQVGGRTLRVSARPVRGERLLDAIDAAYASKYSTPASRKWVRGFRTKKRRAATLEFVPAALR